MQTKPSQSERSGRVRERGMHAATNAWCQCGSAHLSARKFASREDTTCTVCTYWIHAHIDIYICVYIYLVNCMYIRRHIHVQTRTHLKDSCPVFLGGPRWTYQVSGKPEQGLRIGLQSDIHPASIFRIFPSVSRLTGHSTLQTWPLKTLSHSPAPWNP